MKKIILFIVVCFYSSCFGNPQIEKYNKTVDVILDDLFDESEKAKKNFMDSDILIKKKSIKMNKKLLYQFNYDESKLGIWIYKNTFEGDLDFHKLLNVETNENLLFSGMVTNKKDSVIYNVKNDSYRVQKGFYGNFNHNNGDDDYKEININGIFGIKKLENDIIKGRFEGIYINNEKLFDLIFIYNNKKDRVVLPFSKYYNIFSYKSVDGNGNMYLYFDNFFAGELLGKKSEILIIPISFDHIFTFEHDINDFINKTEKLIAGHYVLGEDENIYYQLVTDNAYYIYKIEPLWDQPMEETEYDPLFFEFHPELKKIWDEME